MAFLALPKMREPLKTALYFNYLPQCVLVNVIDRTMREECANLSRRLRALQLILLVFLHFCFAVVSSRSASYCYFSKGCGLIVLIDQCPEGNTPLQKGGAFSSGRWNYQDCHPLFLRLY
ncbi:MULTISPECIES: hypothetical protein [unclassified Brucella]|uniref:hypothetical protein n=1 Tax=unclassified Brucella TaxID=2632610 RepID=UPI0012AE4E7E|nr:MULTISPECIES: hypothetical protein [unclassified Brucella]MRN44878.1 hypothetical protein [Brucella sp. 09RB8913]MRN60351.1 hypothetical protein [Brucella sp. 09RB8918]